MLDDREFYGLLDRVLASGLRAMEKWRDSEGEEPCIAGEVEAFLRLHDSRRHRDSEPAEDQRYFAAMVRLAQVARRHADGPKLRRAIQAIEQDASEREAEARLGRVIPGPYEYWQPVKPCKGQKALRFIEFEPA